MDKQTLTLTLLLTLYGPMTVCLTLTDPRATFIEKLAHQCWLMVVMGYWHYIEITHWR